MGQKSNVSSQKKKQMASSAMMSAGGSSVGIGPKSSTRGSIHNKASATRDKRPSSKRGLTVDKNDHSSNSKAIGKSKYI